MIAAATALVALAIVLHDRRTRQNPVTRKSRGKRVERTWIALANEASTVGDNDRTTCMPVYRV